MSRREREAAMAAKILWERTFRLKPIALAVRMALRELGLYR